MAFFSIISTTKACVMENRYIKPYRRTIYVDSYTNYCLHSNFVCVFYPSVRPTYSWILQFIETNSEVLLWNC